MSQWRQARRRRTIAIAAVCVVVLCAAGAAAWYETYGGARSATQTTSQAASASVSSNSGTGTGCVYDANAPLSPAGRRQVALAERSLRHLQKVANGVHKASEMGTPALIAATAAFTEATAHQDDIPVYRRMRILARGKSAVAPVCQQCFTIIENEVPAAGGAALPCR